MGFVDKVCGIYNELNGTEPTAEELTNIFGGIKEELAEEAQSENDDEYESDKSVEEEGAEELDEETIINSEGFDSEYFAAIQYARDIAKVDAENIWNKISEEYNDEMGEEATSEMILEAFNEFTFAETENEDEESEENEDEQNEEEPENEEEVESEQESEDEVDPELFSKEMELALDHVRELAAKQQESFVNEICEIFGDSNGYEPSLIELSSIFYGIKQDFADEAREDFLEELEDEEDSDYDPNDAEDIKQVQEDQDEDYSDSEESEESEDTQNID